jgi:hypothetical protein
MRTFHILNLGAGVQSTVLYLMSLRRDESELVPNFDYAIFADTGEEPKAVYEHLEKLKLMGGPPILSENVGSVSGQEFVSLGENVIRGVLTTNQRFVSIPAFTTEVEGVPGGIARRQCTREYKVDVIERTIRYKILGLKPRQHFPSDVRIIQYLGLSYDEPGRIISTKARFQSKPWSETRFPLFDLEMTRRDCVDYLESHGVTAPRSPCVFCPYRSNAEWRHLRDTDPEGWQRAIEVDEGLRKEAAICNRGFDQRLYVHRSCKPLRQAPIDDAVSRGEQRLLFDGFDAECEGMCGL